MRALKSWARSYLCSPTLIAYAAPRRPREAAAMADQPKTADDVKAIVDGPGHPLRPALVHRHPRPAEELLDQRGGARRRVRGRHGLRRLVDHRLQRDRGVGHDRHARRFDLQGAPVAARGQQGVARAVLRRRHPEPRALRGRPAPRAAPRARAGGGDGLRHVQRGSRAGVLLLPPRPAGAWQPPEILDEGGYFDLTTLDAGSDVRRETVLALEELGIHVEYTHHEVGPSPARDRHALRRRR